MRTPDKAPPHGKGPNGWFYREGVQSSEHPLEYIMSSEVVDRYGDIVSADGWDLRGFNSNPIALFNHRPGEGIGTWSDVKVFEGKRGKQLRGRLHLAAAGTSARIDEIRGLIEQRVYRAVSVGFVPTAEPELIDEDQPWGGKRYVGQELLECSIVTVPANPEALEVARKLGIPERELGHYFGPAAPRGMSPVRARLELMKLRAAPGRYHHERGNGHAR